MTTPIVFVPGLNCSAKIYTHQVDTLWRYGSVTIANHLSGDSMKTIARSILATAPPCFALVGYSMGGYIAFEILRQARERIVRLALLDTSARPDSPEHIRLRKQRITATQAGRFTKELDKQFPVLVHKNRHNDGELHRTYRAMGEECGPDTFIRHLHAIMNRPDSRPELATIECPTLVLVGDSDRVTLPEWSTEMVAGIKGARMVVVPECGHLSPIERPEAVTKALEEWINN